MSIEDIPYAHAKRAVLSSCDAGTAGFLASIRVLRGEVLTPPCDQLDTMSSYDDEFLVLCCAVLCCASQAARQLSFVWM
jgi:hypothetical protein